MNTNDDLDAANVDEPAAVDPSTDDKRADDKAKNGGGKRHFLPGFLIGLATFLAIVAALTTWVRVQALDTDAWVESSNGLLDEPEIREALSVYVVDVIYQELDVSGEVENALPENFKGLSGPVAAALKTPATASVERILDSTAFRGTWELSNRVAHETLVRVLRDETRTGTSTAEGVVTLELGEVIRLVGEDIGLSSDLLDKLPEDAGRIVVFESDELASAQQLVQVLDFLSWFLFLLVVGLYAAAVYVARDRVLKALRHVGFGLLTAGVIILVVRVLGINAAVGAFVESPSEEIVPRLAAYVATDLLRQIAASMVIYGLLIVLFALLMGEGRWAVSLRRALAPAMNSSVAAVSGGTVIVLLGLVWWAPGRAFDRLVTALTLVALVIGAVVALRRSTQTEFPGVTTHDVAESMKNGTRTVVGLLGRGDNSKKDTEEGTVASQLSSLSELHTVGGLTDEEFAEAKRAVLAGDRNGTGE